MAELLDARSIAGALSFKRMLLEDERKDGHKHVEKPRVTEGISSQLGRLLCCCCCCCGSFQLSRVALVSLRLS
jgi:hypothetical protein